MRALGDEVGPAALEALVAHELLDCVRGAEPLVAHPRSADDGDRLEVVPRRPVHVDDDAGEADRVGEQLRGLVEERVSAPLADQAGELDERLQAPDRGEVFE